MKTTNAAPAAAPKKIKIEIRKLEKIETTAPGEIWIGGRIAMSIMSGSFVS